MPQLDLVSFFSQYIWLVLVYGCFYLTLVHTFLPKMARILKVRASLLQASSTDTENTTSLRAAREHTSVTALKGAKTALAFGLTTLHAWVDTTKASLSDPAATQAYTTLLQENARAHALVHADVKALAPFAAPSNAEVHSHQAHRLHTTTILQVIKKKGARK